MEKWHDQIGQAKNGYGYTYMSIYIYSPGLGRGIVGVAQGRDVYSYAYAYTCILAHLGKRYIYIWRLFYITQSRKETYSCASWQAHA